MVPTRRPPDGKQHAYLDSSSTTKASNCKDLWSTAGAPVTTRHEVHKSRASAVSPAHLPIKPGEQY